MNSAPSPLPAAPSTGDDRYDMGGRSRSGQVPAGLSAAILSVHGGYGCVGQKWNIVLSTYGNIAHSTHDDGNVPSSKSRLTRFSGNPGV